MFRPYKASTRDSTFLCVLFLDVIPRLRAAARDARKAYSALSGLYLSGDLLHRPSACAIIQRPFRAWICVVYLKITDVIYIPFYNGVPPIAIGVVVFEIGELEGVRMWDGKP